MIDGLYSCKRVISNHLFFRKTISDQVSWDFQGMYDLMLAKLLHLLPDMVRRDGVPMEVCEPPCCCKCTKEDNCERNRRKRLAALKICIRILRRIKSNWYFDVVYNEYKDEFPKRYLQFSKAVERFEAVVYQRDKTLLFQLLDKYLDTWWT